ncbi:protein FAM167A-like [Kryptolebias marmoratus]|uniref:Protein FAM167A-like n=1 Tax=Kryptolebias marmoratus TaxID=37003 RepID=A0A3Q2ZWT4_KRYMA|nr:protein FAM167A-like [Kryptolebias marmoratus]
MEVVLTRLRDFSCRTSTFDEGQRPRRDPQSQPSHLGGGGDTAGREGRKLDIESALAWLRVELMEMRSQDQALIRQLMELHAGIQELKQELSEEEEGSDWDSESEDGGSSCSASGGFISFPQKTPRPFYPGGVLHRRSSVP